MYKIINLNNTQDSFYLWDKKYVYTPKQEDKIYFVESIKNIDPNNKKELKKIFIHLLEYENQNIDIQDEDLFGLLLYFVQKLL